MRTSVAMRGVPGDLRGNTAGEVAGQASDDDRDGGGVLGRRATHGQLLLAVGGAAAMAQTGIPGGQQAIAYLIFALIGTLGFGIPVGIYICARGQVPAAALGRVTAWESG